MFEYITDITILIIEIVCSFIFSIYWQLKKKKIKKR